MTLVTRLSLFFLTALALVLVGTSISIFLLVRSQLMHELGDASTKRSKLYRAWPNSGPGRPMGSHRPSAGFRTRSSGRYGRLANCGTERPRRGNFRLRFQNVVRSIAIAGAEETVEQDLPWRGATWRVVRRFLTPHMLHTVTDEQSSDQAAGQTSRVLPSLIVSVAIPISSALAPLRTLGVILAGTSTSIWLASAFAGNWLCRKAIAPVNKIAQYGRNLSAADFSQRLPSPGPTRNSMICRTRSTIFGSVADFLPATAAIHRGGFASVGHPFGRNTRSNQWATALKSSAEEYHRALQSVQRQAEQLKQIIEMLFLAREETDARRRRF